MRKPFLGRSTLPIVTLLSCLSLPSYGQTGEMIGTVIVTKGRVEARDAAGNVRVLGRRSQIFAQDTILVGADGFADIRMVDDAHFSFKPNTEFRFDDYSYDENPATPDSAIMTMARGGFRTVSGAIGDGEGDQHTVNTRYASIGIRGTGVDLVDLEASGADGEVAANQTPGPDPGEYSHTFDGATTVTSNLTGESIDVGLDGDVDYTYTDEEGNLFGLVSDPNVFNNDYTADEEESGEGDGDADADADAGDEDAADEDDGGDDGNAAAEDDDAAAADGDDAGGDGAAAPAADNGGNGGNGNGGAANDGNGNAPAGNAPAGNNGGNNNAPPAPNFGTLGTANNAGVDNGPVLNITLPPVTNNLVQLITTNDTGPVDTTGGGTTGGGGLPATGGGASNINVNPVWIPGA